MGELGREKVREKERKRVECDADKQIERDWQ